MDLKFALRFVSICLTLLLGQINELASYTSYNYPIENIGSSVGSIPLLIQKEDNKLEYTLNPLLLLNRKENLEVNINVATKGILNNIILAEFLSSNNKNLKFGKAFQFATTYINECKREGINHDIAFAQMCLETGYLKFGGSVMADQYNYCGLGAVTNKHCGDSFKSIQEGITAHIQHLKAYVSKESINSPLVDKRFKFVSRGSVKTIFDLSGRWAIDPNYGQKIQMLLSKMYSI